jgi:hypothetical protein
MFTVRSSTAGDTLAAGRADPDRVDLKPRQHGRVGDAGLPEAVGVALGAGLMATALAALESALSNNERARRLVRDGGVRAEFERAAIDLGRRLHPPAWESAPAAIDGAEFGRSHGDPHGPVPVPQPRAPLSSRSPSVSR